MALVRLEKEPPGCLSYRFSYSLGNLKPTRTSGKAIWLCFSLMEPVTHPAPPHPLPIYGGICDIDCIWFINYLGNSSSYPMKSLSTVIKTHGRVSAAKKDARAQVCYLRDRSSSQFQPLITQKVIRIPNL